MGREVHNASMKFCGDFQDLVHTSSEFGNSTLLLESLPLKPEKKSYKIPPGPLIPDSTSMKPS